MAEIKVIYCRNGAVIGQQVGAGAILLNLPTATYYGLDEVGTAIWNRLENPCGLEALASSVSSEFGIPAETAAGDLQVFVDELLNEGIIALSENALPENASEREIRPLAAPARSESISLVHNYKKPALERDYKKPSLERGLLREAAHAPMGTNPDGGHFPGGTCKYS
jgi:hypothetical protein